MTAMSVRAIHPRPAVRASLIVAAAGVTTILGAYFFQYVVGVQPCPLCLLQRKVYYVGIPLALIIAFVASCRAPRPLPVAGGLALLAVIMLVGAGIAIYHSGVEWQLWPGPPDCSGPIADLGTAGGLLAQIQQTSVVRCDQAVRFLGLSLANCNVVLSLALVAVAVWGIRTSRAKG